MGKQPAATQASGGGEPRSRARAASGTAPSMTRGVAPQRHRDESVHGVRDAVAPPHDGVTSTSAAVAGAPPDQRIHYVNYAKEVRFGDVHGQGQSPVHGDRGAEASAARTPQRTPSYLPPRHRRAEQVEQPHAALPRPAAGHRPPVPAPSSAALPEESQPPPVAPRREKFTTEKTIERISTLDGSRQGQPPVAQHPHTSTPHEPRHDAAQHPQTSPLRKPQMLRPLKQNKKRRRIAICFTACCILFWLLVIAVGVAVLVVFLLYHPQSPRLRVTSATLNAGYIDELGGGGDSGGGSARALNADLTVLAAIYNPNTKIHVVLRYMQLDLYFEGSMIGTQAVWPAPLHEGPGGSVLRSVHLVVSEVTMTQEDVSVWQNATTKGGPVMLQLTGRFRTQLNFGRWLQYKYWVTPRCILWLDPPPSGALRRARC